jgi:hypothetical protein
MGAICAGAAGPHAHSCPSAVPRLCLEGSQAAAWSGDPRGDAQANVDYLAFPKTTEIDRQTGDGTLKNDGIAVKDCCGTPDNCLRSQREASSERRKLQARDQAGTWSMSTGSAEGTPAAPDVRSMRLGVIPSRTPQSAGHSPEGLKIRPLAHSPTSRSPNSPCQSFGTEDLESLPSRRQASSSGPNSPLQGGCSRRPHDSIDTDDLESIQTQRRRTRSRTPTLGSPNLGRTLSSRLFGARRRAPQSQSHSDFGDQDPPPTGIRSGRVAASPAPKAEIRPSMNALSSPARWGLQILKFKITRKATSIKDQPSADVQRSNGEAVPPRAQAAYIDNDSSDSQRSS